MASNKNNKARKQKYATKTGEFRHTDGDRRHRGLGASVKKAIRDKKTRQTFAGGIPIDDPPPSET